MVATFNSLQHTHGIQETTLVELMITFEFFKIVMIYNAKYGLCDISGHFGGYGSFVWVHPGRPQQECVQHGPEAGILRVPRMERRLHDDQRQLHRDAGGLGRYPPPRKQYHRLRCGRYNCQIFMNKNVCERCRQKPSWSKKFMVDLLIFFSYPKCLVKSEWLWREQAER